MSRCPFTNQECETSDKCSATCSTVVAMPTMEPDTTTSAVPFALDALLGEIRKDPRTSVALLSIIGALFLPRWEKPLLRIAAELLRQEKEKPLADAVPAPEKRCGTCAYASHILAVEGQDKCDKGWGLVGDGSTSRCDGDFWKARSR